MMRAATSDADEKRATEFLIHRTLEQVFFNLRPTLRLFIQAAAERLAATPAENWHIYLDQLFTSLEKIAADASSAPSKDRGFDCAAVVACVRWRANILRPPVGRA